VNLTITTEVNHLGRLFLGFWLILDCSSLLDDDYHHFLINNSLNSAWKMVWLFIPNFFTVEYILLDRRIYFPVSVTTSHRSIFSLPVEKLVINHLLVGQACQAMH
jgi:hypothetical protein